MKHKQPYQKFQLKMKKQQQQPFRKSFTGCESVKHVSDLLIMWRKSQIFERKHTDSLKSPHNYNELPKKLIHPRII